MREITISFQRMFVFEGGKKNSTHLSQRTEAKRLEFKASAVLIILVDAQLFVVGKGIVLESLCVCLCVHLSCVQRIFTCLHHRDCNFVRFFCPKYFNKCLVVSPAVTSLFPFAKTWTILV